MVFMVKKKKKSQDYLPKRRVILLLLSKIKGKCINISFSPSGTLGFSVFRIEEIEGSQQTDVYKHVDVITYCSLDKAQVILGNYRAQA